MKAFKKLIAAALVCALALTMLTACGGGSGSGAGDFGAKLTSALKGKGIEVTYDAGLTQKAEKFAASLKVVDPKELDKMTEEEEDAFFAKLMTDAGINVLTEIPVIGEGDTEEAQVADVVKDMADGKGAGFVFSKYGYCKVDYNGKSGVIVLASYTYDLSKA